MTSLDKSVAHVHERMDVMQQQLDNVGKRHDRIALWPRTLLHQGKGAVAGVLGASFRRVRSGLQVDVPLDS